MNLINFISQFPDEQSCINKWKQMRDTQGVVCTKCGGEYHYWKKDKLMYECKQCKFRQSLRCNTIMHGSQLPLRYWFIAIHLLTSTKKSFSALEMQRQLGHKYYNPIWAMMHKIRAAMGNRDSLYELHNSIELDEGFFSTEVADNEKLDKLKRGRGSQKKSKVMVMAESKLVEEKDQKKGKKMRVVRYIKMQTISDLKAETIDKVAEKCLSKECLIDTDNSTSYRNLGVNFEKHNPQVIKKEDVGKTLPWVHIAISNAKRLFLNIYHSVKPEYIQYYLDEFCYKFNRRTFGEGLFDRVLIAGVRYKNQFRYNIK